MAGRFIVLVNPRAAAGRARSFAGELEQAFEGLGQSIATQFTEGPMDAAAKVRSAIEEGAEGVAVVGGDGTLNEAVNGFLEDEGTLRETNTWLASIPCGTGGDFRKTLGLPRTANEAAKHVLDAKPRPIDVGVVKCRGEEGELHRAFINIASFGMAGMVDEYVNDGPKWLGGRAAFLLGTVQAFTRYRNRSVRLVLDDDQKIETPVVNVAVANGRYFGGGMLVAPDAEIDDGLFDVVVLGDLSRREQLMQLPDLYRGTLERHDKVTRYRTKTLAAEALDWEGPIVLDVDGETPGFLPARFELHAEAILFRG